MPGMTCCSRRALPQRPAASSQSTLSFDLRPHFAFHQSDLQGLEANTGGEGFRPGKEQQADGASGPCPRSLGAGAAAGCGYGPWVRRCVSVEGSTHFKLPLFFTSCSDVIIIAHRSPRIRTTGQRRPAGCGGSNDRRRRRQHGPQRIRSSHFGGHHGSSHSGVSVWRHRGTLRGEAQDADCMQQASLALLPMPSPAAPFRSSCTLFHCSHYLPHYLTHPLLTRHPREAA